MKSQASKPHITEDKSGLCSKSAVSRAELLWSLFTVDDNHYGRTAELLGFEEIKTREEQENNREELVDPFLKPSDLPLSRVKDRPPETGAVSSNSSYYRIVDRQMDDVQPGSENDERSLPDWFTEASPTILEETSTRIPEIHRVEPLYVPLAPWPRLLAALTRLLGTRHEGVKPDVPLLVDRVARGEFIQRIPRKQRQTWAPTARILIDINEDNFPYRRDFILLREQLLDVRGDEGLEVQYIYDEPGGYIARYEYQQEVVEPWGLPEKGTPILILSDLGMQGKKRHDFYNWLVFGQLLNVQGHRPTALMPVAERDIDKRLLKYFDCIVWDRTSRLKRVKGEYRKEQDKQNHAETVDELLAYFFAAVRVDSGLLRSIRHLLPGNVYDVGHEAALWRHPVVMQEGDEWGWQAAGKPRYLDNVREQLAGLTENQRNKLVELIGRYHVLLPDELYFEAMYGLMMLDLPVPDVVRSAAEEFMQDLVATYAQQPDHALLDGWVKRHLARFEVKEIRKQHDYWLPFLAFAKHHEAQRENADEIEWPDDLNASELAEIYRYINQVGENQTWLLRQSGERLELLPENVAGTHINDNGFSLEGETLLRLHLTDTKIFYIQEGEYGRQHITSIDLKKTANREFGFPANGKHTFQIGRERFEVEVLPAGLLTEETWMSCIGRGSEGTYADSETQDGSKLCWYWHPPEWRSGVGMMRGIWYSEPAGNIRNPDWASDIGRDQYGLWADVGIDGVSQRFRWIEPTSFLMGSPEDEDGSIGREVQHQVILSKGYWLADTACTQALWKAVMGENPSEFKGDDNPVETVSWDDVDTFLKRLNKKYPGLELRFPTEAEWENGCRAGTTGSFNFIGELTLDKVNYRGIWEYESGRWGEGALQKTAEVKSYPPNLWGLYEMHGNVWEWCQDWYGNYPTEKLINPQGPDTGDYRVLRGGSWFNGGRDCRSAYRDFDGPAFRLDACGFRLARGHELSSVRSARSSPAAGWAPRSSTAWGTAGGRTAEVGRSTTSPGGFAEKTTGILDKLKKILKK